MADNLLAGPTVVLAIASIATPLCNRVLFQPAVSVTARTIRHPRQWTGSQLTLTLFPGWSRLVSYFWMQPPRFPHSQGPTQTAWNLGMLGVCQGTRREGFRDGSFLAPSWLRVLEELSFLLCLFRPDLHRCRRTMTTCIRRWWRWKRFSAKGTCSLSGIGVPSLKHLTMYVGNRLE